VPFPAGGLTPGVVLAQVYTQTGASSFTLIGSVSLTVQSTP